MMSISEFCTHPFYTFLAGLFLGLWWAVNCWIMARARGYSQGVRFCMAKLMPVAAEVRDMKATFAGGLADNDPISDLMVKEGLNFPDAVKKLGRLH